MHTTFFFICFMKIQFSMGSPRMQLSSEKGPFFVLQKSLIIDKHKQLLTLDTGLLLVPSRKDSIWHPAVMYSLITPNNRTSLLSTDIGIQYGFFHYQFYCFLKAQPAIDTLHTMGSNRFPQN